MVILDFLFLSSCQFYLSASSPHLGTGDNVTSSSFETEAIVEPFTSVSAPESHPVEPSSLAKVGYGFFLLYAKHSRLGLVVLVVYAFW